MSSENRPPSTGVVVVSGFDIAGSSALDHFKFSYVPFLKCTMRLMVAVNIFSYLPYLAQTWMLMAT